ncbi:MAG: hypothetical protein EOO38_07200 [Cytophagaceae bacterium]|nr:MAG: hypothetical protein EOO38_07200 [Cytophagaceae bacterium]
MRNTITQLGKQTYELLGTSLPAFNDTCKQGGDVWMVSDTILLMFELLGMLESCQTLINPNDHVNAMLQTQTPVNAMMNKRREMLVCK